MLNNGIKKYVIAKDATASVNQILMKRLGPKNQQAMNYVNLGEENAQYDTYIVHRTKFALHFKNKYSEEEIRKTFPRALIKNMIMTIPYSAGFNLCWETYIEDL
jgi:hypothetical protein